MKLKKILIGVLITSMILSNSLIGFAETESATSDEILTVIFDKLKILVNNDNRADIILVGLAMEGQKSNIKTDLKVEFDSDDDAISALKAYDFTPEIIADIVMKLVDEQELVKEMIKDTTLTYDEYSDDVKAIVRDLYYDIIPSKFKNELSYFGENKLNTFDKMLSILLNDTIATQTYEGAEQTFVLGNKVNSNMYEKLHLLSDNVIKSQEVSDNFVALGNMILKVTEDALIRAEEDGYTDIFATAIGLVDDLGMLHTKPNSGGGNTGGGNSGGGYVPPSNPKKDDSTLDDADKEAVKDLEDSIPDEDATEEEQKEAQEKTEEIMDSVLENIGDSKNADEQVAELGETVGRVIEALDGKKAAEVAKEFADLVNEAIDNPNMTPKEQKEMVKDVIGSTFCKLVDNKDVKKSDVKKMEKDLRDLVGKVIENAATFEMIDASVPQAGQGSEEVIQEFNVTEEAIVSVIATLLETSKELSDTLADNDMSDILKGSEQNINIQLPEVEDTDEVQVGFSPEAIASLGESNIGIKVEAEGISFKLPAGLLKTAKEEITISSKPVDSDVKLSDETKGGKTKELKTMDLTVAIGDKSVKGKVELSFSLEDLEGLDVDTIMVGVYEDGVWTKLDYEVIDGYVVFTAPHFSIFSLMTFETSFADIEANWAKTYITSLTAKGIVSGRSDLAFDPQSTITRAEFVTLLVNHLGLEETVFSNYKDVNKGTWYYDIVARAGINSITAGTVNGNFRPEEAITREEMAVMITKAYKAKYGYDMTGEAVTFSDKAEMSDYALEAIAAAKANGIISGYSDNTFRPLATATRAEAATMMYLFLEK